MIEKKHIVRLTEAERDVLREIVETQNGSREKVRRAKILLRVDANGPNLPDPQIARQLVCRQQTVYNVRFRYAKGGLEESLCRKQRSRPQQSGSNQEQIDPQTEPES
jgi:hypothetical protein